MSAAAAQVVSLADACAEGRSAEIIRRAEGRARERGVAYHGQLTPEEAWTLQQGHPSARLVDVRSSEELSLIGRVPGAIEIEWKLHPEWRLNPRFLSDLKIRVVPTDLVLLTDRLSLWLARLSSPCWLGTGWGLSGICPGPALLGFASGYLPAAIFAGRSTTPARRRPECGECPADG